MRLRVAYWLIERATTGRLLRLSNRLGRDTGAKPRARHYVRYLWILLIYEALSERQSNSQSDN